MPRVRDILTHVTVEIAEGRRKCHFSRGKHGIAKATAHLAVKGGPFGARKNYCPLCARPILELASTRIAALERDLDGTEPTDEASRSVGLRKAPREDGEESSGPGSKS